MRRLKWAVLPALAALAGAMGGCGGGHATTTHTATTGGTTTVSLTPAPAPSGGLHLSAPCNVASGQGHMGVCVPRVNGLAKLLPPTLTLRGPLGIDIANYQGCPRLYGIRFAIFRSGEGSLPADSTLSCHIAAAKRAGIPWGAYYFQRPGSQTAQARLFVSIVRSRAGSDPPLGYTIDSEVGVSAAATCTFAQELRRLHVNIVITYTSPGLWPGGNNCGTKLWAADYATRLVLPSSWPDYVAWQYSDGIYGPFPHTLSGLKGDSDVDHGLLALIAKPAPPKPSPAVVKARETRHLHRLVAERTRLRRQQRYSRRGFSCIALRDHKPPYPGGTHKLECSLLFIRGDRVNHEIKVLRARGIR